MWEGSGTCKSKKARGYVRLLTFEGRHVLARTVGDDRTLLGLLLEHPAALRRCGVCVVRRRARAKLLENSAVDVCVW